MTMTKDQLIEIVKKDHEGQEAHYLNNGPSKHDQDDLTGVQMVQENYSMLSDYLADVDTGDGVYGDVSCDYDGLNLADQREVWEESAFHFGTCGYVQRDADFFWHPDGWPNKS